MPCLIGKAINAKSEFECWNHYFSENILQLIVDFTNKYIYSIKKKFGRERDTNPTDIIEMKVLLGLLYLAGVLRGGRQNINDFWTADDLGPNIFRMAMSEKLFRFLIRCIRFDDLREAVRELFTIFVNNCQSSYSLGQYLTID